MAKVDVVCVRRNYFRIRKNICQELNFRDVSVATDVRLPGNVTAELF